LLRSIHFTLQVLGNYYIIFRIKVKSQSFSAPYISQVNPVSFAPLTQLSQPNWVLILHNPNAGGRDTHHDVKRLADLLRQQRFEVEIFTDLDLVAQQANALVDQGRLRALVGVGGDGTAAELVNRTKEGTPLAFFPSGNENLLARYFHFQAIPEKLADTIADGNLVRIDAGKAEGRIFLLMASCGLDAEVVRCVHARRTGHMTSRNYFKPLWDVVRTFKYPELRVYCDEALDMGADAPLLTAHWFSIFNLPCYGGGLKFAPHAVGNDGQLDLCGFRRGGFWHLLRYAGAVYLRQHRHMKDWIARRVKRVRIVSDVPVHYQLDGDPGGLLPLNIEVLSNRLSILVPKKAVG
jgi:diacylglycerol kinase (ATP)